jgi:choline dehydrogenase-like flavoprotein
MNRAADVIVVGSGPSATAAAVPLVRAGHSVLMLDAGREDATYAPLIPDSSFVEIRRHDEAQHRYLLGDDLEGVPFGRLRVGAQLTPPRQYLARDTDVLTPLRSATFHPTESLALGGLGGGWGASSPQWDDGDLSDFPITHADLAPHYAAVAERIGLSGAHDDLVGHFGACPTLQPPLDMDPNARLVLDRYERDRLRFQRDGLFMGHPRLAMLTRSLGERRATQYRELDFYADTDRSVYRPRFTVEELRRYPNFSYERPWMVHLFREPQGTGIVEVLAVESSTDEAAAFTAKRLVLAAGTLGSARIVLRSLEAYGRRVQLVENPHIYIPFLNLSMLGAPAPARRHSLTQAGLMFVPPDGAPPVYGELHVYRSLMLFKLAKESFLPVPQARRILRELMNAFLIAVIEHADYPTPDKWCVLQRGRPGEPDVLEVSYRMEAEAIERQHAAERQIRRQLRRLGCLPIGRIDPGHGASIHYGGTVPMSAADRELTVTPECRLRGTRRVFLADGSVFPYLPAKPLTFSLMANADRVGTIVAQDLA